MKGGGRKEEQWDIGEGEMTKRCEVKRGERKEEMGGNEDEELRLRSNLH